MTYDEFLKAIGETIKRIRMEKFPDRSLSDLAGHVNKNKKAWEKIEEGQANIELKTLNKMAGLLEVPIDRFFEFIKYEKATKIKDIIKLIHKSPVDASKEEKAH